METVFLFFSLFIIGMLFGSFSSVLISRWKNGESGIFLGRSACPNCKHILSAGELIPIVSFLWQRGKCKNCYTIIPYRYPILEVTMGLIFILMGYIAISVFHLSIFSVPFFFILFLGFLTVVYIFYDIFYMEIPDEVFIIFIVGNIILFILSFFIGYENIYFNIHINHTFHTYIKDAFLGAISLYSFLYIQIFISGGIFLLKKKRYLDIRDLLIFYFTFPFVVIWDFFRKKLGYVEDNISDIEEDIPFWVGPGDLFLAIIIGWTLGLLHGIIAFFLAYFIGSIFGIFSLCFIGSTGDRREIPFGPFLGIGFLLSLLFYEQINIFVNTYFLF